MTGGEATGDIITGTQLTHRYQIKNHPGTA